MIEVQPEPFLQGNSRAQRSSRGVALGSIR